VPWPPGRGADIGPVPHPDEPTLAPPGGSSSRTIDPIRLRPVWSDRPPEPRENPGRAANRTAGRGVGIVPTRTGRGARQARVLPRPLASGRRGRPRRDGRARRARHGGAAARSAL
jgi:hypothetical protein